MEKAYVQYVSGWMFDTFGVRPALGRLLTENDDLKPGAHPFAVLSYDYWTRRFGRTPRSSGARFAWATVDYEIVGVAGRAFTGTEPGTVTDIFLPTMMNEGVTQPNSSWFRTFVQLKPACLGQPGPRRAEPDLPGIPGGAGEGLQRVAERPPAATPQQSDS